MKQAVEAQGNQDVVSKEGRLLAGKALQYGAALTPDVHGTDDCPGLPAPSPARHSDVSGTTCCSIFSSRCFR